jgi:hypothetical protein
MEHSTEQEVILIIADISGYTKFMVSSGLAELPKYNHLPEHGGEALTGD